MTDEILRSLLSAEREIGHEQGRIEALREVSRVLLQRIDRARDVRERTGLEAARRACEALTVE
jgi:hypothetical protein